MKINLKKKIFYLFALGLLTFFPLATVFAFVTVAQDNIIVSQNEVIESTFIATGQDVLVEGEVKGDLICAAQDVKILGVVKGDVLCAAQDIKISGKVEGDVRVAAQKVEISQEVLRNATIFAQKITSNARIDGEMFFAAQKADLAGEIKESVKGYGDAIILNGLVGKNADFEVNNLNLEKDAQISGNLIYKSDKEALFSYGSTVFGKVERQESKVNRLIGVKTEEKEKKYDFDSFAQSLAIYLVLALLLISFFEKRTIRSTEIILSKPAKSLGLGLLILIGAPVIAIALIFTIIGIPISLLLILAYAVAFVLSRIIAAIAVGRLLTRKYWQSRRESVLTAVVLGVIICWIAFSLPSIGWILAAAAVIWGFGGVYYLFRD